jgi:hypothetical protein
MSVPVTLAVLDRQDWARASTVPYPMPNSKPGLITVPFRIEDFPGFAEMQADADILAEIISFHEMGHLFAHKAGIRSTHSWVNELVANVFAQAYILAHQPELESYRSAPIPAAMSPRYTSLADLDYLNSDMSFSNYAWFQFQLNRLGAFLAQQQDLRTAVRHLQAAFQATEDVHLTSREVLQHMESIVGGFADQLGLLSQPTTIRRVNESICHSGPLAEGAPSLLIVDNQTPGEVTVSRAGREPNAVGAWQSRRVKVVAGEQLRLSTGGCVLATDEPTVAVIQKAR